MNSLVRVIGILTLLAVGGMRLSAAEPTPSIQAYQEFATELLRRCDPDDFKAWDGGEPERGIHRRLKAGGPVDLAAYAEIGLKAMRRYPEREYRFAEYWLVYVDVAAISCPAYGRPAINEILARPDVPLRLKAWILCRLMSKSNSGLSLSWLDGRTLCQVITDSLATPTFLFTERAVVSETVNNRVTGKILAWDTNSDTVAAWAMTSVLVLPRGLPPDLNLVGTPAYEAQQKLYVAHAKALLPMANARAALLASTADLIDHRVLAPMSPETAKNLARSHVAFRRPDAAAIAHLSGWAIDLITAGDEIGRAAATGIAEEFHRKLAQGAYLQALAGGLVEVGTKKSGLREQLRDIPAPNEATTQTPAAFRAWLTPIVQMHATSAEATGPMLGELEWGRTLAAIDPGQVKADIRK